MKRITLVLFLVLSFSILAFRQVHASIQYNFYVVDTLVDGSLDSCVTPGMKCTLNSALSVADKSPKSSVLQILMPSKNLNNTNGQNVPFYLVRDTGGDSPIWKLFPAPLISATDLTNLHEDITDYLWTINTGIVQSPGSNTFFWSLFVGQFRKFYPDTKNTNDYDVKNSIYRIIQSPTTNLEFSTSKEAGVFVKQIASGQVDYQKISLNGVYLRIYEQSLSRAVFLIVLILTILFTIMNLLVFPNLIIYFITYLREKQKSKTIGLIYDTDSKTAVSFASIRIFDMSNGQKIFLKQTISDLDGKYFGFTLSRGKYLFQVQCNNYKLYEQVIEVFETENIVGLDIGISKEVGSFNKDFITRVRGYVFNNIKNVNKFFIFMSVIIAIINILIAQNVFNLFILIFAFVQYVLYRIFSRKRNWGVVVDQRGNPIKAAFVKAYNPENHAQLDVKLTDEAGRFGFVVRQKTYLLSVKAFGYKYPASNDTNPRETNEAGEVFIKLNVPDSKKINLRIILEKEN